MRKEPKLGLTPNKNQNVLSELAIIDNATSDAIPTHKEEQVHQMTRAFNFNNSSLPQDAVFAVSDLPEKD